MNAPLPKNEAARLKALHQYQILDTTPEVAFDKLTQLAAQICETPIAIVSLVDEYRQWFKSKVGLDVTETSRDVAFCAYTILQPDVLIVPDAQADCRFAANPLVTKEPYIRFYAAAPLTTPEGDALGTLCVIDKVPRTLRPEQVEALRVLSSQVIAQLELRLNLVNLSHVNSALRQSEEQFRLLFEKSMDAILVTDDNGNCLRANPAASTLLGYSREQLLSMNVSDIYTTQPPGAMSCFNACNNAGCATGEFSFQRADGLQRQIDYSACQLAPGQNLSILRNITSRKQAEELLQKAHAELERRVEESQRQLAALIDSLPGIAFFCANTPEYPMTYLSEGCFTLTGYKNEELVGEKGYYKAITHPEDLPKVLNAIETAIALQQPYVVEYRICSKSGEEKWLWEKGNLIRNSNDQIVGMKGFISDITERKWTEEALRQAEEKYRGIFENAVEGIFQTDPQGFYISANPTLAKIYGYNSPEELMKNLTNISQQLYLHSDRRAEFMHRMQKHDIVSNFEHMCRASYDCTQQGQSVVSGTLSLPGSS